VPLYILQNIHWDHGMRKVRYNVGLWMCRVRIEVAGTIGLTLRGGTTEGSVDRRIGGEKKGQGAAAKKGEVFDISIYKYCSLF